MTRAVALLLTLLALPAVAAPPQAATRGGPTRAAEAALARKRFASGLLALKAGRIGEARNLLSKTVALAPEWDLAYIQLALAEQAADPGSAKAGELLQRAVELNPKSPRAHMLLGQFLARSGKDEAAMRHLDAALGLRASLLEARFSLGVVLGRQGKEAAAIEAFRTVLRQSPRHTGALAALADLHERAERFDEAEEALIALTRLQPAIAYHQYRLAQFYQRIGEDKKALAAFARADDLDPRPKRRMRRLR